MYLVAGGLSTALAPTTPWNSQGGALGRNRNESPTKIWIWSTVAMLVLTSGLQNAMESLSESAVFGNELLPRCVGIEIMSVKAPIDGM